MINPLRSLLCCLLLSHTLFAQTSTPTGMFEGHQDVGTVLHAGSATFDSSTRAYTVTGSGENMWGTQDAFHFVWKKISGDVTLTADIQILSEGGDPHRKAALMIRQSLDADSAYADAALHGDGLTSLQFRDEKGGATHEVQSSVSGPRRLRLTKRGEDFYMSVAGPGEELRIAGGSARFALQGSFYIGLGVCAHNKDRTEKAVFSNVELKEIPPSGDAKPVLHSTLETITVSSTDRKSVYVVPEHIEAPNWTPDGTSLIFNSKGRLHRIPATGGKPDVIDTGFAIRCNNDHGISPDGTMLAISDGSQEDKRSRIYVVPISGGTPRRVTESAPSYWHGWSPDGKTLTFCGQRDGEFDIYTIPVEGGKETRLTSAKGLDDGPEYSPDGKYIYFNSERSGRMQIWRMHTDGSEQEQVTSDDYNNWFPHLSPDGRSMAFLTYGKEVTGHPANKDVMLRLMSLSDQKIRVLAKLFGGQGTINVPSWSPDSRRIAFVSYQLLPPSN
ncbi:MAG: TolB family protein [Bryobacteraceae bacterium]|nr:TolB family protein [Bryobacteraceae bacterium]